MFSAGYLFSSIKLLWKLILLFIYPKAAERDKIQGTFLKKDDPKLNALMQQAELLSSLALKVNTENTDQSLENAWKVSSNFAFGLISSISIQCFYLGTVHQY